MDTATIVAACRERAMQCYGNQILFEARANRVGSRIRLINLFGICIPLLLGAIALGYGIDNGLLKGLLPFAAFAAFIQFIISSISIINSWDKRLSYAYEATQAYNSLYSEYTQLAHFASWNFVELKRKYDLVRTIENQRSLQDSKEGIKGWEYRFGMKATLRQHRIECVGCNVLPNSLNSTGCDICGNYSFSYKYLPWK